MVVSSAANWPPIDLPPLHELVSFLINSVKSAESYHSIHPLISTLLLCVFFILSTFTLSTITGNYSYTDRVWSVTPWMYVWNYFIVAWLRGYGFDTRLFVMAVLTTLWGLRLTYNFYRKGKFIEHDAIKYLKTVLYLLKAVTLRAKKTTGGQS